MVSLPSKIKQERPPCARRQLKSQLVSPSIWRQEAASSPSGKVSMPEPRASIKCPSLGAQRLPRKDPLQLHRNATAVGGLQRGHDGQCFADHEPHHREDDTALGAGAAQEKETRQQREGSVYAPGAKLLVATVTG